MKTVTNVLVFLAVVVVGMTVLIAISPIAWIGIAAIVYICRGH